MKPSHWLSDSLRRISARERRFILAGALAATTLVVLAVVVVPFVRRWTGRETTYAANREQWARLSGVAGGVELLRRARDERLSRSSDVARLVTGATPALAASGLQSLLQRYADETAVQLDRVDVAAQPRTDRGGLLAIPAQLQGQSDIWGLAGFLYSAHAGTVLLVIDELSVNAGTDGHQAGETLIWTLRLHGLYRAPRAGSGAGS
jgi:Type II secretion system (T2SS), protein M